MDIQSLHRQIQQQTQRQTQVQCAARQAVYKISYLKNQLRQERQVGLLLALRSSRDDTRTNQKAAASLMAAQIQRMHNLKQDIRTTEKQLRELDRQWKALDNRTAVLEKLEHSAIGGNAYSLHQADLVGLL